MMVSRVWRGAGTALFLELGELDKSSRPSGAATICIEWSWRIEDNNKIIIGSFSEPNEINQSVELLQNSRIDAISFFGHLKEIDVLLSNGNRLSSYSTVGGDPCWSIRINQTYLSFENGSYTYEASSKHHESD